MRYSEVEQFKPIFLITLAVLSVISLVFIVLRREKYKEAFLEIKNDKCNVELTLSATMFVAMTLVIGALNLWMSL